MLGPGLRGAAVLTLAVLFLGALPVQAAQADSRAQAVQAQDPEPADPEPDPEPTKGSDGSPSEGNEEPDPGAPTSDDPTQGDNPDAGTQTTPDERFEAGAVLGWAPRDELSMSDKDFVIVLWEKADEYFHPEVKKAAKDAFADMTDPDASANFIKTGIFAANKRDAALKVIRAQRDTERLSAAQELGWVPADDDDRRAMLRSTIDNFLVELSRKAEAGSQVRAGAEAVVGAAEEQQLAFIATGVHVAAKADRDKKIEDGKQEEIARQQAKLLRDIKGAAIAAALGRIATEYELGQLAERELIYKIKTETPGVKVKAAATVAYDSEKPEDWRAYLATGVHVARTADIAERDREEAAENERKVRAILNDAKFDKYQPKLAAAANQALQGDATARALFLVEGKDKAAKLDVVRPAAYMTIALQGSRSKRCVQVAGSILKPNVGANGDKAPLELWDCNENGRQRWEVTPIAGSTFALKSANSKRCLEVPAGKNNENVRLIQNACVRTSSQQHWVFLDTGKGTMELRNVASNKVITVPGSATANASVVAQANNTNTLDQQWRVIDFSHHQLAGAPLTGKVVFKGLQSNRCLEPVGATSRPNEGANADRAPMELWNCDKRLTKQTWQVVPVAGNRFALKNASSGKCLDIVGGGVANATALIQYRCHPNGNEQWVLMSAGKQGNFMLRNVLTGTYVDVKASGTAAGSAVHTWAYTGRDNQRWIPQPIA
jgi:hypothetical protein